MEPGVDHARAERIHRSIRPHDYVRGDCFDERTLHRRVAIDASHQIFADNIRPELIAPVERSHFKGLAPPRSARLYCTDEDAAVDVCVPKT
jgi:hypothetical protein